MEDVPDIFSPSTNACPTSPTAGGARTFLPFALSFPSLSVLPSTEELPQLSSAASLYPTTLVGTRTYQRTLSNSSSLSSSGSTTSLTDSSTYSGCSNNGDTTDNTSLNESPVRIVRRTELALASEKQSRTGDQSPEKRRFIRGRKITMRASPESTEGSVSETGRALETGEGLGLTLSEGGKKAGGACWEEEEDCKSGSDEAGVEDDDTEDEEGDSEIVLASPTFKTSPKLINFAQARKSPTHPIPTRLVSARPLRPLSLTPSQSIIFPFLTKSSSNPSLLTPAALEGSTRGYSVPRRESTFVISRRSSSAARSSILPIPSSEHEQTTDDEMCSSPESVALEFRETGSYEREDTSEARADAEGDFVSPMLRGCLDGELLAISAKIEAEEAACLLPPRPCPLPPSTASSTCSPSDPAEVQVASEASLKDLSDQPESAQVSISSEPVDGPSSLPQKTSELEITTVASTPKIPTSSSGPVRKGSNRSLRSAKLTAGRGFFSSSASALPSSSKKSQAGSASGSEDPPTSGRPTASALALRRRSGTIIPKVKARPDPIKILPLGGNLKVPKQVPAGGRSSSSSPTTTSSTLSSSSASSRPQFHSPTSARSFLSISSPSSAKSTSPIGSSFSSGDETYHSTLSNPISPSSSPVPVQVPNENHLDVPPRASSSKPTVREVMRFLMSVDEEMRTESKKVRRMIDEVREGIRRDFGGKRSSMLPVR